VLLILNTLYISFYKYIFHQKLFRLTLLPLTKMEICLNCAVSMYFAVNILRVCSVVGGTVHEYCGVARIGHNRHISCTREHSCAVFSH
jgi:hypothetical protein